VTPAPGNVPRLTKEIPKVGGAPGKARSGRAGLEGVRGMGLPAQATRGETPEMSQQIRQGRRLQPPAGEVRRMETRPEFRHVPPAQATPRAGAARPAPPREFRAPTAARPTPPQEFRGAIPQREFRAPRMPQEFRQAPRPAPAPRPEFRSAPAPRPAPAPQPAPAPASRPAPSGGGFGGHHD
jgi:hypothetical protein